MSARDVCINRLVAQALLAGTTLMMVSCAPTAVGDSGADQVLAEQNAWQSESHLATQAPAIMQAAEEATEEAKYAVSQRKLSRKKSDQVWLDARSREADLTESATGAPPAEVGAARSRNDTLVAELAAGSAVNSRLAVTIQNPPH